MITHGWWNIRFHGHESYMSCIHNSFGEGFWSWRKFATCGRTIVGYWTPSEYGKGRIFHGGPWEYQEMFIKPSK